MIFNARFGHHLELYLTHDSAIPENDINYSPRPSLADVRMWACALILVRANSYAYSLTIDAALSLYQSSVLTLD